MRDLQYYTLNINLEERIQDKTGIRYIENL